MKNNRCLIAVLIWFIGQIFINAQKGQSYFYYFNPQQIIENAKLKRIESCQVFLLNYDDENSFCLGKGTNLNFENVPEIINAVSCGKVYFKLDTLYCYDKLLNRMYIFKKLNSNTIEVVNNTAEFVKGTKLYLHVYHSEKEFFYAFYNLNDLIHSDYWKTGVRNGFNYMCNGTDSQVKFYQNNQVIDSILFNNLDSASTNQRLNFFKKYNYQEVIQYDGQIIP